MLANFKRLRRKPPVFIEDMSATIIVGLAFCTLAWIVGQQVL